MAFCRKSKKRKREKNELLRPFHIIPYLAISVEIKQDFDVHGGAFAVPGTQFMVKNENKLIGV